jgi:pimeloyl-ACP methyl ester carboxylesterase
MLAHKKAAKVNLELLQFEAPKALLGQLKKLAPKGHFNVSDPLTITYRYIKAPKAKGCVVFFHGFPGDADQGLIFNPVALEQGYSLLSLDRPGYRGSSALHFGDLKVMSLVLEALLEDLKIEKFSLVGYSGGAPYALTAAKYFGDRAERVAILCGLAPIGRTELKLKYKIASKLLNSFRPIVLRNLVHHVTKIIPFDETSSLFKIPMPKADRIVMRDLYYRTEVFKSISIIKDGGASGLMFDGLGYQQDWSKAAASVQDKVKFWHGDEDGVLSINVMDTYKEICPRSTFETWTGEGHFSLPVKAASEAMNWLSGTKKELKRKKPEHLRSL